MSFAIITQVLQQFAARHFSGLSLQAIGDIKWQVNCLLLPYFPAVYHVVVVNIDMIGEAYDGRH